MMNSFVHRDWVNSGFIEIDQTPSSLQFENPGEYRFKDLLELVRFPTQSKFYRNSLLADFMFQCGLVDQEASGISKKIIEKQKERGLPLPEYNIIQNWTRVFISSKIVNINFARLMLKQIDIEIKDLVLLDKIIKGENKIGENISKVDVESLKQRGFVEITGTRYQKAFLSKKLSKSVGKTGNYTKMTGLKKEQKIQLILKHINDFGQVKSSDLDELFPEMTKDQKANLLNREMHRRRKIIKLEKPSNKKSEWYYLKNDDT